MSKVEIGPVITVGDLRKKIGTLLNDDRIFFQVVAKDGTAWYMSADAGTTPKGKMFCITLRHPDLKVMPKLPE